jgi:hypothetical protein
MVEIATFFCMALIFSSVLALRYGTLRLVWAGRPSLAPPRFKSQSWTSLLLTLIIIAWAFFAKDCVDQPLNALAHDPSSSNMVPSTAPSFVQAMSWSSWTAHLWWFAIDGQILALMVLVVFLGIIPDLDGWLCALVVLGRLAAIAFAVWVHAKLTPDSPLVSVALILLVVWAVRIIARAEIQRRKHLLWKRELRRKGIVILEGIVVISKAKTWAYRIILSLTAAAFEAVAWQSDTFLKYLDTSSFVLLFTVVAGVSDIVGGAVREQSDALRDEMIRQGI